MNEISRVDLGIRIGEAMNRLGFYKLNHFYPKIRVSSSDLKDAISGTTKSSQERVISSICVHMNVNSKWFYADMDEQKLVPFEGVGKNNRSIL